MRKRLKAEGQLEGYCNNLDKKNYNKNLMTTTIEIKG